MKPEEIISINAPSGKFHRAVAPAAQTAEVGKKPPKDSVKKDKVSPPRLDHIQFNKLETSNTDSQDIAQAIREVNHTMQTIDVNLRKMRSALESIVKIYPPYPPGSTERVEALRQFSAFRKMIDQIARPGPVNNLKNILGDPGRHPGAGDWTPKPEHPRRPDLTIRHQPVHIGPGGLDIPEMSMDSSDAQITAAIDKTASATQILQSRRRLFVEDANRVISHIA